MKFTLNWLKEHLETDAPLAAIVEKLTSIGLEVEAVIDPTKQLSAFVIGEVADCSPHPDADKLKVCQVNIGAQTVQVVCGAPNAKAGMKGVFAPAGTVVPGTGLHLKKAKIRGVESNGMLCSERELGISDEHDGIIELPADAEVGTTYAAFAGLDDPVVEIGITPNRQDCLGVAGIARDLSAAGLGTAITPQVDAAAISHASPIKVECRLGAHGDACPLFVGRHIRNVKNGPSPRWLQDRLRAIGLRPISALVDITNFITFDRGRPLHAFDADTIAGSIHVRLSNAGENILALDGRAYELDDQVTVIADDDGPLAMGGIIGGESSGCTLETKSVFLEAALFDPIRTAMSGRKHDIISDARYRFERGVDPDAVYSGMELATQMVLDLCGGEASELVIAGEVPEWRRSIAFRPARVHQLGGLDVSEDESLRILRALGFGAAPESGGVAVAIPSWRRDIDGEADLVEEVLRVVGYDKVPIVPLEKKRAVTRPALNIQQRHRQSARRVLAARGMNECVTWSFMPRRFAERFGGGKPELTLVNPISADLDVMRPSILPNLLAAAGRNVDRGFADLGLFEVGPQYGDSEPEGQQVVVAGVRRGNAVPRNWHHAARAVDAFDAKADVLAVLAEMNVPVSKLLVFPEAAPWYHPGRSGTLRLGPKTVLAAFGEVHPSVLDLLDCDGPCVAFEINVGAVPKSRREGSTNRGALDVHALQTVERDFAFVVAEAVPSGEVVAAALGADKKLVLAATVFDVFSGESLGPGVKSIAIRVTLQPIDHTLTETEIDAVAAQIVGAVEKSTGATLRGQ
ncbi:MAG: phenylalanine--tRNA ligase subunit beta [Proteobacteria bacterium]|nr:phenylalanine--tRNA ligase subunit beta [Pseudomonadota bacterium]